MIDYNETVNRCSRLLPLSIISRKWAYIVLRTLRKPKTFSQLLRELHFITNRILSRELRFLEEQGLINHISSYSLTNKGLSFLKAIEPLVEWGVRDGHLQQCPEEKECSTCEWYPTAVGARTFSHRMKEMK